MSELHEIDPRKQLLELAHAGESAALTALLDGLSESDRVHALGRMDGEERAAVLVALRAERAAELLEEIPDAYAAEAIQELEPADAADILDELASDEQADLLASLDAEDAEAILAEAAPETVESVRALLRHAAESAGGLMITEFVGVDATSTVQSVVGHLRANVERYEHFLIQYVYATGPAGQLMGVLPLRDLLLARPERTVRSLMIADTVAVQADATLETLFELFDRHRFLGIPVVEGERLVGIVLREAVDEARVDRAEANERISRGIVGGEELRSMPLLLRTGRRLSWLSVNVALNIGAASVIALYQETLSAAIALAVFLPIISDMSGCSGNQAVAVSLRELSLGVTKPSELFHVWWKEASVGILNGVALGVLLGAVAWLWKGNVALSLVVGSALAINTLVAVSIGGVIPLVLKRLGHDPALASGPILTTVTDVCGFFFVLSFATLTLSRLAG